MDQIILNLMLSHLDGSPEEEESESETNSTIDGFELMKDQCTGNCIQKMKSILMQVDKTIKLKDRQLESKDRQLESKDRQIEKLITLATNKSPEMKQSIESTSNDQEKVYKDHDILDIVPKCKGQLKGANALLEESNESVKRPETQNEEVKSEIVEQTESESKLKEAIAITLLEDQIQRLENQLEEIRKNRIVEEEQIKTNYEAKIKELEAEIETKHKGDNHYDLVKLPKQIFLSIFPCESIQARIENNIAGPGWIVIGHSSNKTLQYDISDYVLDNVLKIQTHELYIYYKNADGSSSFAHFDDFQLYIDIDTQKRRKYAIKSLGNHRSSWPILRSENKIFFQDILYSFYPRMSNVESILMIRPKTKYELFTIK